MTTPHTPSQHSGQHGSNVINIFTGRPLDAPVRICRISPETDDLEVLYTNDAADDRLFSLKIVCWALLDTGDVVGMVPWLNDIVPAPDIDDPLNGHFEGYYNPASGEIFYDAPDYKRLELELAADFFVEDHDFNAEDAGERVLQEIPDTIGTHAVLTATEFHSFYLVEVFSWRLTGDGRLSAMLIDEDKVESTPILVGDSCLFSCQDHEDFRYFFQHRIANKIKEKDPEALAAIAMLIDN